MYLSSLLRRRVEALEKVELMFSLIENNISFLSLPSAQLIHILSSNEELHGLGFLAECSELLNKGYNFRDAWISSLSSKTYRCFLNRKDIDLLKMFCENFGTSDLRGEISNCRFCSSLLKDKITQARKNREKYGNVLS